MLLPRVTGSFAWLQPGADLHLPAPSRSGKSLENYSAAASRLNRRCARSLVKHGSIRSHAGDTK